MSNFGRGGIRDCVDITFFDTETNKPVLFVDSLKMATTEIGAETVFARGGRGNPRRIGWDSSKDVNVNAQDCLVSPESLALQFGTSVSTGAQYVPVTDVLTITGTTGTLSETAYLGDATNYPYTANLNTNNDNSTIGTELEFGATPTTGEFSISGTTITFGDTLTNQKVIVTYYTQTSVNNKRVTLDSDNFPATFKLTGYTLWRDDINKKDYPCRITIERAKLLAPFTITQAVEGDPSVFDMNFAILKPSNSDNMIIYDIETDQPIS